jgi:hypothetical protein
MWADIAINFSFSLTELASLSFVEVMQWREQARIRTQSES